VCRQQKINLIRLKVLLDFIYVCFGGVTFLNLKPGLRDYLLNPYTVSTVKAVLTWMQNLLCFGVAGTEGAVQLEVIHVVEEGAPHRKQDILNQTKYIKYIKYRRRSEIHASSKFS
jgi:hypothetical protein